MTNASAIPSDELLAHVRSEIEATIRGERPLTYILERTMFLLEWLEAERRENALPLPATDPGRLLIVANLLRSLASGDVTDARWYWREARRTLLVGEQVPADYAEQCHTRAEAFTSRARLELEGARALERFVDEQSQAPEPTPNDNPEQGDTDGQVSTG